MDSPMESICLICGAKAVEGSGANSAKCKHRNRQKVQLKKSTGCRIVWQLCEYDMGITQNLHTALD